MTQPFHLHYLLHPSLLSIHLCDDTPLWLLGVHRPLRCVSQVVCNSSKLEKGDAVD
jgi:hypothetical protein